MDLGTKFKNIRHNNNMNQDEMAKILKINRNNLSRIETNKSYPTAEVLTRLANHFNISIDSLLEINLEGKDSEEIKTGKIKKITQYCSYLTSSELDFILNVLCIMSNNSKNKI